MESLWIRIGIEVPPKLILNGKTKIVPEDFIVMEVFQGNILNIDAKPLDKFVSIMKTLLYPLSRKKYIEFTLIKRGYSTFDFIELLKKYRIKKVWFCGLKDRFAVTSQRMSIEGKYWKKLLKVIIKARAFKIKDVKFKNYRIKRGMNQGNYFVIRIRGKYQERHVNKINEILSKPLPNFFGIQRFGVKRPNNHKIGYLLIKGDYEGAAKEILKPYYEVGKEYEIRKKIIEEWGNWNIKFPGKQFWLENFLLRKLRKTNNFEKAILSLPKDLIRLWIDAYQSYLFNKLLSRLYQNEIFLDRLPLISYNLNLDKWFEIKDFVKEILEEESITLQDFKIRKSVRPRVVLRNMFMNIQKISVDLTNDSIILKFLLGKGEYASIILYFLGVFHK